MRLMVTMTLAGRTKGMSSIVAVGVLNSRQGTP